MPFFQTFYPPDHPLRTIISTKSPSEHLHHRSPERGGLAHRPHRQDTPRIIQPQGQKTGTGHRQSLAGFGHADRITNQGDSLWCPLPPANLGCRLGHPEFRLPPLLPGESLSESVFHGSCLECAQLRAGLPSRFQLRLLRFWSRSDVSHRGLRSQPC